MHPGPEHDKGVPFVSAVFILAGIGVLCIAAGLTPAKLHAPAPVIGAVGVAFMGAGAAWFLRRWPRVGRGIAGTAVFAFGVVLAWAAKDAQNGQINGGLPFLGPAGNGMIFRVLAGLGAVLCFVLAAAAVRRAITR